MFYEAERLGAQTDPCFFQGQFKGWEKSLNLYQIEKCGTPISQQRINLMTIAVQLQGAKSAMSFGAIWGGVLKLKLKINSLYSLPLFLGKSNEDKFNGQSFL